MSGERCRCLVPFCRRTTGKQAADSEWVCREHWMMLPKRERRIYYRIWREIERCSIQLAFWKLPPGSPERLMAVRYDRRLNRLWARLKRKAIEGAVGL